MSWAFGSVGLRRNGSPFSTSLLTSSSVQPSDAVAVTEEVGASARLAPGVGHAVLAGGFLLKEFLYQRPNPTSPSAAKNAITTMSRLAVSPTEKGKRET
jgi:hypothetical protein